jgi:hypothetical protein
VEAVENSGEFRGKTVKVASRQGKSGGSFPQFPQIPCGKLSFAFSAFSTLRLLDKKTERKKLARKWKKGEWAERKTPSAKREEEERKGKEGKRVGVGSEGEGCSTEKEKEHGRKNAK